LLAIWARRRLSPKPLLESSWASKLGYPDRRRRLPLLFAVPLGTLARMANATCPKCNARFPIADGQPIVCPSCGAKFKRQIRNPEPVAVGANADDMLPPSARRDSFAEMEAPLPPPPPRPEHEPEPETETEPHTPPASPQPSYIQRAGFRPATSLLDIFDLQFEKYVTPLIIKLTWLTALVCASLWLLALLVLTLITWMPDKGTLFSQKARSGAPKVSRNSSPPWLTEDSAKDRASAKDSELATWFRLRIAATAGYIMTAIATILGVLWIRVILESMIVLFNIAKSLSSIDTKIQG